MSETEKSEVVTNCDHLAGLKFSRTPPYAFTEHGAIMAANVLNSARAVEMSVFVVRAFVKLREVFSAHRELSRKLDVLEHMGVNHDESIRSIISAIRQLMDRKESDKKAATIGFDRT